MKILNRTVFATSVLALTAAASAQDGRIESYDFEGGKITITEKDDGQKEVAFNGTLLASNYSVFFDQIAEVGGQKVALISVGDGGNACSPGTLIVFNNGTEVTGDYVGEDCASPSPAIANERIVFVPYLLPGETADVLSWSPDERIGLAGHMTYATDPDSRWDEFDAAGLGHMLDAFKNDDIYKAANALLGSNLTAFATSLSVGGGPETLPSGIVWSRGCVPHACSVSDGFMAIDPKSQTLYLAQQAESGAPLSWPKEETWPVDVREAMHAALADN